MRKITYDQDGLTTIHNCEFIKDPKFKLAYDRGMKAHEQYIPVEWRVHVALWVADTVKNLEGDFVECGVNKGILSSSIMEFINWNYLNKQFFLFDTFNGLDPKYTTEQEKQTEEYQKHISYYSECFEQTKKNFKEFKNIHLIKGSVPETLKDVQINTICYLSLDMNCAIPEIAAAEYFWPKMVSGAMVLLDDYAYAGYEEQKREFDKFAYRKNITILHLPTGQGLYVKP